MKKKRIVVVGGGMAGTAAAYTLLQKGFAVTILEKNDRLGGRIHSITTDDAIFEVGAGFLTDIYKNTFAFLKKNGLEQYLQIRKSKSALIRNNKLHPLFSVSSLFGNAIVSHRTKRQLVKEILKAIAAWSSLDVAHLEKAILHNSQSVTRAFQRNNAQELLDYLIQPLLDGYFYWSLETTSEAMLLLILKAALLPHHTYILRCGLQRIPEIAAEGSEILLSHEVTKVKKLAKNKYIVTVINNNRQKTLQADGIVMATTATEVIKILSVSEKQKEFFSSIHYSSTAVIAQTYKPRNIPPNYAIAYPRKENKIIGAVTIVSDIGINDNKITLVKLFASGVSGKKICGQSDTVIDKELSNAAVLSKRIFDYSTNPTFRFIHRWTEALPEFSVGHFNRLKTFMSGEIESEKENIVFAGDYVGGPFIEGAFTSGMHAADRLMKRLG